MAESKINDAVNKMVDDLDRSVLRGLQVCRSLAPKRGKLRLTRWNAVTTAEKRLPVQRQVLRQQSHELRAAAELRRALPDAHAAGAAVPAVRDAVLPGECHCCMQSSYDKL